MTASDAQIEIAILASIERQANRTAAALQRVLDLMGEVEEKKGLNHADYSRRTRVQDRAPGNHAPHRRRAG